MLGELLNDKINLIMILIVLVVIYSLYDKKIEKFDNDIDLKDIKFKNSNSIKLLMNIQDDLKKRNKNNIYSHKLDYNGHIMWKYVDFMEYILITDEAYPSYEPKKICNNLKIGVRMYINDLDINDILGLNNGITYDRIKCQITIRGDSLHYVLLVLSYVIKTVNNIRNKEKIKDELNEKLKGKLYLDDYNKLYDECIKLMDEHLKNNKAILPNSC
jgi:hypothetical protein